MSNDITIRVYCLAREKHLLFIILSIVILFGLELANKLLMCLLGLQNTAWPWSFIQVLRYGFVLPVCIAFSMVYIPIFVAILCFFGGVKRAIAQKILFYWVLFLLLSTLGLAIFINGEGINLQRYPWLIYSLFLRLSPESVNNLIICLVGCYSILLIMLVWKCFSEKAKAEKIFGKAHFCSAFEIQSAGLYVDEGIVLGKAYGKKLKLPGFEGVLVVAPTGSGKTTAIAVPNLLEWAGSGVFNDLKGELYRLTANYRKNTLKNECFLWAPADINRNTACYNPFFYVSHNPDLRIRDLQLISETLIPATKLGEGFWYQSSREVFLMLALFLFETKGTATLSEIHDLSKQENFFEWLTIEITEHEEEFSKYLKQNIFSLLGADERTQKNILKDFHSRMNLFNDPIIGHATHKNDFDFTALRRRKISIYIHIPDADKERLSPILTLFWAQLINVISSYEPQADEPYGILALMDEFGNMARINKLKDGLSFLRSYRMRCILIVQYLAQITSVYGRDDVKGFLNSKVKIAFALNDIEDAQFFSKSLGSKAVKVASSSVSTGHGDSPGSCSENFSFQSRALMTPDEIMQLSNKKAIILMESRNPIKADKCYWFRNFYYKQCLVESMKSII